MIEKKEKERLISNLISSLNGGKEDYPDVIRTMNEIKLTKDKKLIKEAKYIYSIL